MKRIRRIDVFSAGGVCAAIALVWGLVFLAFVVMATGAGVMMEGGDHRVISLMVHGGTLGVITVILYPIIGFVIGAVSSLVYNAAAALTGGLRVEIE